MSVPGIGVVTMNEKTFPLYLGLHSSGVNKWKRSFVFLKVVLHSYLCVMPSYRHGFGHVTTQMCRTEDNLHVGPGDHSRFSDLAACAFVW